MRALVGPNGSGKTTALRALAGAVLLDGGRIELGGGGRDREAGRARACRLGIVRTLQSAALFDDLTALENVLVAVARRRRRGGFARTLASTPLHRSESAAARETALEALDAVGLRDRADERARELSTTERRLLMIAAALGTDPQVLLLDEPSAGSGCRELAAARRRDPRAARPRARAARRRAQPPPRACRRRPRDRARRGRVIAQGTPDEVGRRSCGAGRLPRP